MAGGFSLDAFWNSVRKTQCKTAFVIQLSFVNTCACPVMFFLSPRTTSGVVM